MEERDSTYFPGNNKEAEKKSRDIFESCYASAKLYYNYLSNSNGKGIAIIDVTEFEVLGNHILLYLSRKTNGSFLEQAEYFINGHGLGAEELRPQGYEPKESVLKLSPLPEYLPLFENLIASDIKIVTDMKFLVKRVEKFCHNALLNRLQLSIPDKPRDLERLSRKEYIEHPSDEQYHAITSLLTEPCVYIWGAPGTGKTRMVLSHAILERIKNNQVVSIFAATNNALDQILFGVIEVLEEYGIDIDSTILRLGIPTENLAKKYPKICENRSLENELENIKTRREALDEYIKAYTNCGKLHLKTAEAKEIRDRLIYEVNTMNEEREKCENMIKKLAALQEELAEKQAVFDEQSRLCKEYDKEKFSFEHLTRAFVSRQYREEFKERGKKLSQAEKESRDAYQKVSAEYEEERLLASDMRKQLYGCEGYYAQVIRFNSMLDGRLDSLISDFKRSNEVLEYAKSFAQEAETLYAEASEALLENSDFAGKDLSELHEEKEYWDREYERVKKDSTEERIKNVLILASTVDTLFVKYDLIAGANIAQAFLDEAAYCPLIKSVPLFSLKCPVALLGDHMQLPPVCEASEKDFAVMENRPMLMWTQPAIFIEDLFANGNFVEDMYIKYINRKPPSFDTVKLLTLNETYRFSGELSSVLAKNVYSDSFHSAEATAKTTVSCINAKKHFHPGAAKRTNQDEAEAILEYITACHPEPDDTCIIAAYQNQVKILRDCLPNNYKNIYTIHKSQGQDWNTVILSVVDNNTKDMFFMNTKNRKARGLECVVTAVSRAKQHLILACDYEFWIEKEDQLIQKLLKICEPLDINAVSGTQQ